MKSNTNTQFGSYEEFAIAFSREISSNKFVFRYFGFSALIFTVFGFLIWVIAFGLFFGLLVLALIFDAPYRFIRWIYSFDDLPSHLVKPPLSRVIYAIVSLVFPAFFVFIGVKGLQYLGFYSQNLIWIFSRVFSIIFSR